jgi:hypothetical protein
MSEDQKISDDLRRHNLEMQTREIFDKILQITADAGIPAERIDLVMRLLFAEMRKTKGTKISNQRFFEIWDQAMNSETLPEH